MDTDVPVTHINTFPSGLATLLKRIAVLAELGCVNAQSEGIDSTDPSSSTMLTIPYNV